MQLLRSDYSMANLDPSVVLVQQRPVSLPPLKVQLYKTDLENAAFRFRL